MPRRGWIAGECSRRGYRQSGGDGAGEISSRKICVGQRAILAWGRSGSEKNVRAQEIVPKVDIEELEVSFGLRGHIEGRRRNELTVRAAKVVSTVKHILVFKKVIPGVFALIHRKSVCCRVEKGWGVVLEKRRWWGLILRLRRRVEVVTGVREW